MEEGYYSRRLDELEKRKIELLAQRRINKMSLDGVNKEIEVCKEAMNNQTKPINTYNNSKDAKILSLTEELDESKEINNLLKKEITQLKHDLFCANQDIDDLKRRLLINDSKNSDNSKQNIFEQLKK